MSSWSARGRASAGSPRLPLLVVGLGLGGLVGAAQLGSVHGQLTATYLTAGAALAVAGAVVVRRRAAWSTGWPAVLLGCATTVLASLVWSVTSLSRPAVAGTVVVGAAVALEGYVRLVRAQASRHHPSVVQIDAVVLTVGLGYVAWFDLLEPLTRSDDTMPAAVAVYGTFLVAALVGVFLSARLVLDRPVPPLAAYLAAMPLLATAGGFLAVRSGALAGDALAGWAAAANFGTCVLLAAAAVLPTETPKGGRRASDGGRPSRPGWVALAVTVPVLSAIVHDEELSRGDGLFLLAAITVMAGLIALRVDIVVRERDASLRALDRLAHDDPLTGLANRRVALAALEHAVADDSAVHCLAYIDLAAFKEVNDTYGHEAGDRLLAAVAVALAAQAHPGDTVARIGGDEFILLTGRAATAEKAEELRARLAAAVGAVKVPVRGTVLRPAAYVGVALTAPGSTVRSLLAASDQAMYADRARQRPRDRAGVAGS